MPPAPLVFHEAAASFVPLNFFFSLSAMRPEWAMIHGSMKMLVPVANGV